MGRSGHGAVRSRELASARITHYPPNLHQDAHTHSLPHVSIVAAGSFREATAQGERVVCQGSVGFRADAASHAVRYGPAGALILTFDAAGWMPPLRQRGGVRWLRGSQQGMRQLLALLGDGGDGVREEAVALLLELWGSEENRRPKQDAAAPAWLKEAAEHLLAAPEATAIAALAARCGVHRVHFSRLFLRHYGMAPSAFRRRAMTARAIAAALGEERTLAGAAAAAGFADQSHLARAAREGCGMTAGALRTLLADEVTFVQGRPLEEA